MSIDPIVEHFASEIAARPGRDEEEILKDGLSAHDFDPHQTVDLTWIDGSRAKFKCAFAIVDADKEHIGVFTEHCGYFSLPGGSIEAVIGTKPN